ncbi:alkaline phosphatase family protein [Plantactinospora sp. KBS50]|uniref:alkaline phosphatase family protein n=1 Tax=Plantactinospora sp. KBS50 TaxID=2024580 RepID=UPI0018DF8098|nr:alkaline phosphatase family protein [Plantactinospora sp. KBS50]
MAGAVAGAPLLSPQDAAAGPLAALPSPAASGIEHIVVVCMENRSFDHLLGWLPAADGKQAGLSFADQSGTVHPTHHLTTTQGCAWSDPNHSYDGGRTEYNNGACDGWLRASDVFSIGYYQQNDLPFLGKAAPAWTVCDNFFASTMGPTFPNRLYLWGAQTDRTSNTFSFTSIPTIFDRLAAAGVSRRYYYSDVPFSAMWGLRYLGFSKSLDTFFADAAAGTLPAVSYVEPALFLEAVDGLSNDYHPHGDIRNGEAFLNRIYQAVTRGPGWPNTVLVFTFDEWGGFFDHVPPASAPDTNPAQTGLRGFRIPTLVVAPTAPRGSVAHGLYDHTSILKMIEWRYNLASLTPRDAAANNLAEVLDFGTPDLSAPQWDVPSVFVLPCFAQGGRSAAEAEAARLQENADWAWLRGAAIEAGWPLRQR